MAGDLGGELNGGFMDNWHWARKRMDCAYTVWRFMRGLLS